MGYIKKIPSGETSYFFIVRFVYFFAATGALYMQHYLSIVHTWAIISKMSVTDAAFVQKTMPQILFFSDFNAVMKVTTQLIKLTGLNANHATTFTCRSVATSQDVLDRLVLPKR